MDLSKMMSMKMSMESRNPSLKIALSLPLCLPRQTLQFASLFPRSRLGQTKMEERRVWDGLGTMCACIELSSERPTGPVRQTRDFRMIPIAPRTLARVLA